VTHRAVAEAAEVPTELASRYFPAPAQLYVEAVRAAEEIRGSSALEMARALPQRKRSDTTTAIALIEVFYAPGLRDDVVSNRLEPMLAAHREPALRAIMLASRPRLLTALRIVLERSGYRKVAAGPDVELLAQSIDASLLRAGLSGEKARLLELVRLAE
jgi:DNA-binding transcriptional regulator YbjK